MTSRGRRPATTVALATALTLASLLGLLGLAALGACGSDPWAGTYDIHGSIVHDQIQITKTGDGAYKVVDPTGRQKIDFVAHEKNGTLVITDPSGQSKVQITISRTGEQLKMSFGDSIVVLDKAK